MNTELKDAYEQYKALGFIMQKSAKNKKFTTREGAYADRINDKWDDNATGYVAIVPPNIIVVDVDSYEYGCQFDALLEKLNLDYVPEPSVLSPSGGLHYVFENKYPDMVIGMHGFIAVDIFAGFQSVVPIVGTTVKNKQGEFNSYKWDDDNCLEDLIVNPWNESMLEVLQMRERVDGNVEDFDEDGLMAAIKADNQDGDEVEELCDLIPIEDFRYDTGYLTFAMAMYDRFEGSEEGLALFQKVCARAEHNNPTENSKKWNAGHFKSNGRVTYKTLKSLANEGRIKNFKKEIASATSSEELESIAEKIQTQRLNTPAKKDDVMRTAIVDDLCEKSKELDGKPERVKWKNAVEFDEPAVETPQGTELYLCANRYIVRHNSTIIPDVNAQSLGKYLGTYGIVKKQVEALTANLTAVENLRYIPDYLIKSEVEFNVEPNEGTQLPSLVVRSNPLINIGDYIHDDGIINDFVNEIWGGKVNDIVRLIALTIKMGEQKLNRLMIVAPSDSGKSEICTMLGFQKINMKRLLNGMRADKGIGSAVVSGIRKTALLLIDEANDSLQPEVKDMDKELHIDQFGSGGTQILPLHFTTLTSTHSTATRNNSDELYNRFLQIELTKKEMKHTVPKSKYYERDSGRYTKVISSYMLSLFRATILGDEGDAELKELQDKYRLPTNNDLDEVLFDIGNIFIDFVKSTGISKNGKYYLTRKNEVSGFFNDRLNEIDGLDVGKFSEKLTSHFVIDKRTSVKHNGKAVACYEITMTPFTEDVEQLITAQFDDLTIEDF